MYLRLSWRRFLFYMKERSELRDWMKNKKIRYERREDIQAKKKNYLPSKIIYRTYLYSKTPNSITSSCNSIGARGVTGTSRFKATVSCAWNNCFMRLKQLFHTLETLKMSDFATERHCKQTGSRHFVMPLRDPCFFRSIISRCRITAHQGLRFSENAMYRTLLVWPSALRTFFSSKQKTLFPFALHSPFTIFI